MAKTRSHSYEIYSGLEGRFTLIYSRHCLFVWKLFLFSCCLICNTYLRHFTLWVSLSRYFFLHVTATVLSTSPFFAHSKHVASVKCNLMRDVWERWTTTLAVWLSWPVTWWWDRRRIVPQRNSTKKYIFRATHTLARIRESINRSNKFFRRQQQRSMWQDCVREFLCTNSVSFSYPANLHAAYTTRRFFFHSVCVWQ